MASRAGSSAGWIASALLLGVLLVAGVDRYHRRDIEPPLPARPTGPRTVFPADRLPKLALPDGQVRTVRSLLNVPNRMRYGQYVWNDAGIPPGPTWIRVDLAKQSLSVFRGGHEVGAAVILYGMDDKETPPGTFPILEKAVQHKSTLYDAEMPWMLRLTNDGIAIHASDVKIGYATHGCIGVPADFARRLFGAVRRGDPVVILPA